MCCSAPLLLAVGVVPSPEIVERIDSNTNEMRESGSRRYLTTGSGIRTVSCCYGTPGAGSSCTACTKPTGLPQSIRL